jgi:hypothetical protein
MTAKKNPSFLDLTALEKITDVVRHLDDSDGLVRGTIKVRNYYGESVSVPVSPKDSARWSDHHQVRVDG